MVETTTERALASQNLLTVGEELLPRFQIHERITYQVAITSELGQSCLPIIELIVVYNFCYLSFICFGI
jgi:hypothetical protein